MEEKVNSDKLGLKIRMIKGEIRENKREKERNLSYKKVYRYPINL